MKLVQHWSEPLEHKLELLVVGITIKDSKTLAIYSICLDAVDIASVK